MSDLRSGSRPARALEFLESAPAGRTAIAAHLGERPDDVAETIDRLIARGFVVNQRWRGPQRRTEYEITPVGEFALRRLRRIQRA